MAADKFAVSLSHRIDVYQQLVTPHPHRYMSRSFKQTNALPV